MPFKSKTQDQSDQTTHPAPKQADIKDAQAAKDASVLSGKEVTPAKPAAKPPAKTRKTEDVKEKETEPKKEKESGHRAYATKEVPAKMKQFSRWIEREYPEQAPVNERTVTIASKAYRYFQQSDMNQDEDG